MDIDIQRREIGIRHKRLENGDEKKVLAPKPAAKAWLYFPVPRSIA